MATDKRFACDWPGIVAKFSTDWSNMSVLQSIRLSVTDDVRTALGRLWIAFCVIWAFMGLALMAMAAEALWPSEVAQGPEPSGRSGWAVLWVMFFLGLLFYQVRKNLWRPYWIVDRLGYGTVEKRNLVVCIALAAVRPALGLAVLALPLAIGD